MTSNLPVLHLVGNYTCSNRGDAAILRGLIEAVSKERPSSKIVAYSENPGSAQYVLGRSLVQAPKFSFLRMAWLSRLSSALYRWYGVRRLIKHPHFTHLDPAKDRVIFVGGSYFVDLYGSNKAILPLSYAKRGIKYALCGHSLGPFETQLSKDSAAALLQASSYTALRDSTSLSELSFLDTSKLAADIFADTAWLCEFPLTSASPVVSRLLPGGKGRIAMTVRKLAPFEKRLNTTQEKFEKQMAALADALIAQGYEILCLSMCTGLGGYHHDDRLAAMSVQSRVKQREAFHVVMDELTDAEIHSVLKGCAATVGTRMHSTILSMLGSTPAFCIPYEHKSVGLFEKMGFGDRVIPFSEIDSPETAARVLSVARRGEEARAEVERAVAVEKASALEGVRRCLTHIQ